jgi:hypothetical protein
MGRRIGAVVAAGAIVGALGVAPMPLSAAATFPCRVFPADNIWNARVDQLPLLARSTDYVASIGATATVHPDFGSGTWAGAPIGIPYLVVSRSQTKVRVAFEVPDESDRVRYPIPRNAPIEGGPASTGDRHVIVIDKGTCKLYELYSAYRNRNGSWRAYAGAVFDLRSDALRPSSWTSADAAGLAIFPGLVRYAEVASGEIRHALRFTAPATQRTYVWPARHFASSDRDPALPPMGTRFRLKADFDISGFAPPVQVILTAMKRYGLILADNGSPWYVSGAPDRHWDNDVLHALHQVPGSAFEAVDTSGLMVNPNSAATLP